jgi:nucleotide-binding universal stress UspA family protein
MFKRILVPLDGSDLAEEAIGLAAAIARRSNATLDLLMVHQPAVPVRRDPSWVEKEIVAEKAYLERVAGELASGAGVESSCTLVRGKPAEQIVTRSLDGSADLVVMTSHGRTGWSRAWIGSVADAVMRGATVPVLMLRPAEHRHNRRALHRGIERMLVPLDGSAVSMEVMLPAARMAKCWGARVDLIRVVEPVPMILPDIGFPEAYLPSITDQEATNAVAAQARQELARDAEALRREGVTIGSQTVVVSIHTARMIADYAVAHEVDLIAMATHGRGMSRMFIGSVADKVRRASEVPVMLVRPRYARIVEPSLSDEAVAAQLPALSGV